MAVPTADQDDVAHNRIVRSLHGGQAVKEALSLACGGLAPQQGLPQLLIHRLCARRDSAVTRSSTSRFRGFALSHACTDQQLRVPGDALHTVLPAAVLYLSDSVEGPADLHVRVQAVAREVIIDIAIAAVDRPVEPASVAEHRPLNWHDVRALAQAQGISLTRQSGALQLRLPALGG